MPNRLERITRVEMTENDKYIEIKKTNNIKTRF
jgi:hypothetical protein